MICFNFNSAIMPMTESNGLQPHSNIKFCQIPSQMWSVNEKAHEEVYIVARTCTQDNVHAYIYTLYVT